MRQCVQLDVACAVSAQNEMNSSSSAEDSGINASLRRMACDKINADGGEEDTKSFAQGERFVQENQSEHGAANDKHAIDRDDDAGRPFG